ncbi:hypothetical protein ACFQ0T_00560 [Kitasatospora gansuensis]
MSTNHTQPTVTVLGLGPMGRALAGAFVAAASAPRSGTAPRAGTPNWSPGAR